MLRASLACLLLVAGVAQSDGSSFQLSMHIEDFEEDITEDVAELSMVDDALDSPRADLGSQRSLRIVKAQPSDAVLLLQHGLELLCDEEECGSVLGLQSSASWLQASMRLMDDNDVQASSGSLRGVPRSVPGVPTDKAEASRSDITSLRLRRSRSVAEAQPVSLLQLGMRVVRDDLAAISNGSLQDGQSSSMRSQPAVGRRSVGGDIASLGLQLGMRVVRSNPVAVANGSLRDKQSSGMRRSSVVAEAQPVSLLQLGMRVVRDNLVAISKGSLRDGRGATRGQPAVGPRGVGGDAASLGLQRSVKITNANSSEVLLLQRSAVLNDDACPDFASPSLFGLQRSARSALVASIAPFAAPGSKQAPAAEKLAAEPRLAQRQFANLAEVLFQQSGVVLNH